MAKLYKTNDYFNLNTITWHEQDVKTEPNEKGKIVTSAEKSKYSLSYSDVNDWDKYTTFNGSECKHFLNIDDAISYLEERWMGVITNQKQVHKELKEYKKRNMK